MKSVKASFVVASFILTLATSAFAQSSVAGAWDITIDTPQGPNTSTLTLKQDGDKLSGELASQMGTTPVQGAFTNGNVAVTASIDLQGMALQLGITGKVEGDALNGNVKLGDFGEFPFTGKRSTGGATAASRPAAPVPAAAATSAPAGSLTDLSGKWDVVISLEGMGEFPVSVDFKQDGSQVTGTFSGPAGDVTLQGTMTGSALRMEFEVETPQGKMPIVMTGDLSADGLVGKATLQGMGEANWKGTRAK